jgi:hypothetical protein
MNVEVILRGRITIEPTFDGEVFDADECIERVFEQITDDLYDQGASEPSVAGSVADGFVEISVLIENAESRGSALDAGEAIIRSALHAAEVWTTEWEANKESLLRAEILEVATAEALQPA